MSTVRQTKAAYLLPIAILLGGAVLAITRPPRQAEEADPVLMELPAAIGSWTGETASYCHNEACLHELLASPAEQTTICPRCGDSLHAISLAEARILPGDSRFARMLYRRSPDETAFVSIVITGSERSSIHRPEWCLPAQGYQILGSAAQTMETPYGAMEISSLNVGRENRNRTEAKYLYWFSSGNGRHTPNHRTRLMWMALDSLAHGEQHRWAYVSVLLRTPRTSALDSEAEGFIEALCAELYPAPE